MMWLVTGTRGARAGAGLLVGGAGSKCGLMWGLGGPKAGAGANRLEGGVPNGIHQHQYPCYRMNSPKCQPSVFMSVWGVPLSFSRMFSKISKWV